MRLTMSKDRGHEQHEIEDISGLVDYISNLPDCIVHHILSFMSTKEAIKTSILSTRWKNLWAFVPSIDFDDKLLCAKEVDGDVTSFVNFVDRAFRLRGALNIKKFRLTCSGSYEESQIHSWISYAIKHNVQELDLCLGMDPSMIPWSSLNGTSLGSLKITMDIVIKLPSFISFPCLKTLHLEFFAFVYDGQIEKLLLGCPVLEELVLLDTYLTSLNNIVISNSNLKRLTIHDMNPMIKFGVYIDPTSLCKIKIDATNLTFFEYIGFLSNEIILNNVSSSLVKACMDILPNPRWQKLVECQAVNILKQLQHVASLSVSKTTIESLLFADNVRAHFPLFENLSHLMLTREVVTKTFGALMDFLDLCPVLKSICLSEGFMRGMDLGENDSIWSSIPKCISNSLKTVTLKNFRCYKSEICFLKWVLKYARVLERMYIWWSETDVKKTEVMTEYEMIERSSIACVVKFS